jgi:hypothetical protein
MTYEEIHERLARLTDIVDIPKIEALRDRIGAGRESVKAALTAGKSVAYVAPAEATLKALSDDLSRMEVNALTPFKVALGLTMVADDLAEIALPKGSVISASIPGVCDWTVTVGLDLIPF